MSAEKKGMLPIFNRLLSYGHIDTKILDNDSFTIKQRRAHFEINKKELKKHWKR